MPRRGPLIGGDNTILDPEYAFADDAGDPLGARNRATVEGQRAAAADAAQREQDRQDRFALLAAQQGFQGQRDAFDAQQANQRQSLNISAAYQQHLDTLNAQERERAAALGQDRERYLLEGASREQQHLADRQDAAEKFQTQRGDEYNQLAMRQAHEDDRQEFDAAQRLHEQRFQADAQSGHMAEKASLDAWVNSQELSHKETIEYQRLQNARATVKAQFDAGDISEDEYRNVMTQIMSRVDPMKQRLERQQMQTQQAAEQQHMAMTAKQAAMTEQEMRYHAQTFGEHVGEYIDGNGKTWHGFQTKPGHWDVKDPYEREAKEREHLFKMQQQTDTKNEGLKSRFEGRLESSLKQTKSQWQSDFTNTSRAVDKEIHDAEMKADKPTYDASDEQKSAEKSWVAKLKANRDTMIHDRMTQIKRWSQFGADKDALDAALEKQKQEHLDGWQAPLQRPEMPEKPAPTGEKPNSFGGQRLAQPETINPPSWRNAGEPTPEPVGAMPRPEPPPTGPPAAGGAMQQIDQMIDEAQRGGNQSVGVSATRIKAALSKYRTVDQMPPAEREQFLRDLKNAGLDQ